MCALVTGVQTCALPISAIAVTGDCDVLARWFDPAPIPPLQRRAARLGSLLPSRTGWGLETLCKADGPHPNPSPEGEALKKRAWTMTTTAKSAIGGRIGSEFIMCANAVNDLWLRRIAFCLLLFFGGTRVRADW